MSNKHRDEGSELDHAISNCTFAWAWRRARHRRNNWGLGGLAFAVISAGVGYVAGPAEGIAVGAAVVVLAALGYSLLVAPKEQRAILLSRISELENQVEIEHEEPAHEEHVKLIHEIAATASRQIFQKTNIDIPNERLRVLHAHTRKAFIDDFITWTESIAAVYYQQHRLRIRFAISECGAEIRLPTYQPQVIRDRLVGEIERRARENKLESGFSLKWANGGVTGVVWAWGPNDHPFDVPRGVDAATFHQMYERIDEVFRVAQSWTEPRALVEAEAHRDSLVDGLVARLNRIRDIHDFDRSDDCPICHHDFTT
jgi:hypothetical protein